MTEATGLEIFEWDGEGYVPLVFSQGWQAAILNWEPGAETDAVYRVEKHADTDEVFVLWRGHGALVMAGPDGVAVVDAVPGKIYNVTRSAWHTVIGTKDSSWLIVENRDTHLHDTTYRDLSEAEMAQFRAQLPDWARQLKHAG